MKNSILTSKIKCVIFNLDAILYSAGVKNVLRHLGLPYAVVSVENRASILHSLGTAGLLNFFGEDSIFSGEQVFLPAVRGMGFGPAECAVVYKNESGIDLAMKEGFWIFGMNDGGNEDEFEKKGVLAFNEFSDLTELIELFNEEAELEIKQL